MIPPERRIAGVRRLIDLGKYFVVHAPRQMGKTTLFRALAWSLTAEGKCVALHATCEEGAAFSKEPVRAEQRILRNIADQASLDLPADLRPPSLDRSQDLSLREFLASWSQACPRPLVLFLDEIDALMDEVVSILRQLRAAFPNAPKGFPQSIALIGLRDVRDYRARIRPEQSTGVSLVVIPCLPETDRAFPRGDRRFDGRGADLRTPAAPRRLPGCSRKLSALHSAHRPARCPRLPRPHPAGAGVPGHGFALQHLNISTSRWSEPLDCYGRRGYSLQKSYSGFRFPLDPAILSFLWSRPPLSS